MMREPTHFGKIVVDLQGTPRRLGMSEIVGWMAFLSY